MAGHDPNPTIDPARGPSVLERRETVEPHSGVDDTYRCLARAFEIMDLGSVRRLLTEQAVFIAPDATASEGPAEIAAQFEILFRRLRERGMHLRLSFDVEERGERNDVVYDRGSYTLACRIAAAELPLRRGRYLAVFRRSEDSPGYRFDAVSVFPLLQTIRAIGVSH